MQSGGPVTMPFIPTAAIYESNTTLGFADSDLQARTPEEIDRTLDEMQAMGVQNVRILVPWGIVEPWPGFTFWETTDYIVNAAYERDMGVLADITSTALWASYPGTPAYSSEPTDPEAYARFAAMVAERYEGKVSAYEIYNEVNTAIAWAPQPDAEVYVEVLKAAYTAIKEVDPEATVVAGGLISTYDYGNLTVNPVGYLEQMYANGAAGYFDALSFHPYHYTLPFSQGRPWGNLSPINQMDMMHELMVANGDGDKLIWSTEYGVPTTPQDEQTQAAFISDYLNAWSQIDYAGPSFIYTTRDRDTEGTGPEDTLGVLREDFTWKPAAYVIQQWTATHPQEPVPDPVTLAAFAETLPDVMPTDATALPEEPASTVFLPTESTTTSTDSTATTSLSTLSTVPTVEPTVAPAPVEATTAEVAEAEVAEVEDSATPATADEPATTSDSDAATTSDSDSTSTTDSTSDSTSSTESTSDSTSTSDSSSTDSTSTSDSSTGTSGSTSTGGTSGSTSTGSTSGSTSSSTGSTSGSTGGSTGSTSSSDSGGSDSSGAAA
jgi:hypothetical protein